jgi:hypothetical protein
MAMDKQFKRKYATPESPAIESTPAETTEEQLYKLLD